MASLASGRIVYRAATSTIRSQASRGRIIGVNPMKRIAVRATTGVSAATSSSLRVTSRPDDELPAATMAGADGSAATNPGTSTIAARRPALENDGTSGHRLVIETTQPATTAPQKAAATATISQRRTRTTETI